MERKHIFRDLFYLAVGATAMALAYKTEDLVDRLFNRDKYSVKISSKLIKEYKKGIKETRKSIEKKKDEIGALLAHQVDMSKHEIRQFLDRAIAEPHDATKIFKYKIDHIAAQLSKSTDLSSNEAKKMIESVIQELHKIDELIETELERVISSLQNKTNDNLADHEDLFLEMGAKTITLRGEVNFRSQKVIDEVIEKLNTASKQRVDGLQHHLRNLEKY